MRFVITLIFLLVSIPLLSANFEISKAGNSEILQGAPFQGVIRIWPFHNLNEDFLSKLEGKQIEETIYIVKIDRYTRSDNNYDVFEIYGTFVLLKDKLPLNVNLNGERYDVKKIKSNVIKPKSVSQKVIFLDHESPVKTNKILIYISVFFCFVFALVLIRKLLQVIRVKKEKREKIKIVKKEIVEAKTRNDLERLYFNLKSYEEILNNINSREFKQEIKNYLYVKEWEDETLLKIQKSKEVMQRSISGI